jgi:hypothetical protein
MVQRPRWTLPALLGLCLLPVLLVAAWVVAGVGTAPAPRSLAAAQGTATETEEPTEAAPTPIPVVETPPVAGHCLRGLPSPRFQWTLYVTTVGDGSGAGMWVPRGDNAGPFLKAHVMAKYGEVWYGATFQPDGRLLPDRSPAWPRPDLIQSAATGIQTSRSGNPACGRNPQQSVPPCVVEVVYPLVFLDRLAEEGPYLTRTYFWVPSNQLVKDGDRPSQIVGAPFSETDCDTRKIWPRLPGSKPAYGLFNGCASASSRLDSCYAVGNGEFTPGRDGRLP